MGHPQMVQEVFVNSFNALSKGYPVINPLVSKDDVHVESVGLVVDGVDVHELEGEVDLHGLARLGGGQVHPVVAVLEDAGRTRAKGGRGGIVCKD